MMNSPEPGCEIDGFRLGELIHAGSMALIYRLVGPGGPLPLIMKIPRLGVGERAVNVTGFEVCRMVLGALGQGPHHPTLVAYGDVETTPYLVIQHVDGSRLSDLLPRTPLPPEEIARLGAAVAIALHDLHQRDVVHLDLKPTNIMFCPNGEVMLIDFGLAHHGHLPDLLAEELRYPVGNWVYMAPEQILGVRCDPRSDVYALGGILYELATGRLPFGRPQSISEVRRRLYIDPVPPRAINPAVPEWLQEIILRCLEVNASERYASAEQVALELMNPAAVALTERGARRKRPGWVALARRRLRALRFVPAPCPPLSRQPEVARVAVVALTPNERNEVLLEALRRATRNILAADPTCRIACVTVVPPAAGLNGEGEEGTATGRQIKRLIELRHWARPLELPDERLTCHVLESEKPAAALIDYAKMNDVDQVLIGAPRGGTVRLMAGVSAQLVAEAPCSVSVVRAR
jgi:nucleotide-binding universal stress UspA family protein